MSATSTRSPLLNPVAIVSLVVSTLLVATAIVVLSLFLATLNNSADPNAEATGRLVQWQKIFEDYRTANGTLPDMPDGGYCLGSGFPVGSGGTANCRDVDATSYYTEEASAPLLDALSSVGELPEGHSEIVRGTVGPYALYQADRVDLITAENGSCVEPAQDVWTDGEGLHMCVIALTR